MDLPHKKTISGGTQTEPKAFLWKRACESDRRVMYARVTKWWHYVQKIEVKGVMFLAFIFIYVPLLLGFPLRKHSRLHYNLVTHATHDVTISSFAIFIDIFVLLVTQMGNGHFSNILDSIACNAYLIDQLQNELSDFSIPNFLTCQSYKSTREKEGSEVHKWVMTIL